MTEPTSTTPPKKQVPGYVKVLFSTFPILLTLGLLGALGVVAGYEWIPWLVALMATIFFAAGKFIVFAGLAPDLAGRYPLAPFYFAALVTYMDVCVAFLVAFNLDWLFKLKRIGARLRRMQENSMEMMEVFPRLARATFIGCMLFVAFPLTGTGAIGGTLLGRMMGLSRRRTMAAIGLGAVVGSFGLAWGAWYMGKNLETMIRQWYVSGPLTVGIVGFFIWLNWYIRAKVKAMRREKAESQRREVATP